MYPILSNNFLGFVSFSVVLLLTLCAMRLSQNDGKKIAGLTLLSLLLVFYYAASFQANGSLVIGIARVFKINLFGWDIPSTTFASLEALFAFILSPLLSRVWLFLGRHFFDPSVLFKIIIGLIFAGLSFLVFSWVFFSKSFPLFNLILANLLLGASVACIFPTHIAAVSNAPIYIQGTLMGVSFLSDALAGYVGSLMNNVVSVSNQSIEHTFEYFYLYLGIAVIMFGVIYACLVNHSLLEFFI